MTSYFYDKIEFIFIQSVRSFTYIIHVFYGRRAPWKNNVNTMCASAHDFYFIPLASLYFFSPGCLKIRIVPRDVSHTAHRECVAKKSTLYHVLSFYNHPSFARWWNFYIFGLWINIMTEDLHIERYTRLFWRLAFRGFPLLQKT